VQFVTRARSVNLEILIVLIGFVFMSIDTNLVVAVSVGDSGIEADVSIFLVVHGANLKAILVSTDESRLLAAIARGSTAHDGCLGKDTRSTVGVGSELGVYGGEGNGVLVVLAKMEMSREPGLRKRREEVGET
jgi:hypothetical protein